MYAYTYSRAGVLVCVLLVAALAILPQTLHAFRAGGGYDLSAVGTLGNRAQIHVWLNPITPFRYHTSPVLHRALDSLQQ